jgi:hypothetical protein
MATHKRNSLRTLPADGGVILLGYNHQSIHLSSKEGCPSG